MPQNKKPVAGKNLAWLLTMVYFSSYVTRINFAAVIQEVVTATGFAKTDLSVALVCLSTAYGVGQIINGRLGDRIAPQNLILLGLISATVINAIFPALSHSTTLMAVVWGMNGFAQAMMWPPIVKILVANMDDAMYSYAVVRVSWGSSFGTIIVYLLSPLIIGLCGWQGVFFVSAVVGLIAVLLWLHVKNRIAVPKAESRIPDQKARFAFPSAAVFPMVFIALGIIFQGMLRDGISSWMPTLLAESFHLGNRTSIFCTVSLAVFSILSFSAANFLYRRFFRNEVVCGGVIFIVSVVSALLLYFLFNSGALLSIFLMAVLTACMHGVNLMLITHVPKRFKKYGNISTISGAVNSCTYIGSAIFTYAVALLSEKIGWQSTVGVWALIALLGTACCFVAAGPWKKFYQE